MNLESYKDALKRYYKFDISEKKALIITIATFALIMAFDDGQSSFEVLRWSSNLIIWVLIVTFSVLLHHAAHRLMALKLGFKVEYKLWWPGIIGSLIVAFITKGTLPLLIAGGIYIHHLPINRIGFFRYGPNTFAASLVAMMGPLANIFFASLLRGMEVFFPGMPIPHTLIDQIFFFNVIYAAYCILPIPPLDGSRMFFHSRLVYAWVVGAVGSFGILSLIFGVTSILWSAVSATVIWFIYYIMFERHNWKFV